MPIYLHIDDNIKYRILSNAFVNFGALLFDARRNDITDDQAALASKQKTVPKIQTMCQWFEAFHIRCNIHQCPYFSDENFRKWH